MNVLERMANSGIVPVVVIDDAKDAVDTANAMLKGGIDVMEITFRTAAAGEAIKNVSENCPDMLVGAGTVLNLEQCKTALSMGAKFIVSPGFNQEVVAYCIEKGVAVTPGCVTPTEITAAVNMGLKVIKFFPANVYGGLSAMKNLSAPFVGVKFLPTGGVNTENIKEYIRKCFNKVLKRNGWSDCQDSKSALTTEKIHFKEGNQTSFSIDLCIVTEDDNRWWRLIHKKTGFFQTDEWIWNEGKQSNGLMRKVEFLKDNNLWNEVRDTYLEKKNMYLRRNDHDHPSFICYIEAVNEVYDKH